MTDTMRSIRVADDGGSVSIEFDTAEGTRSLTLSTQAAEALVRTLADARAAMQPAIPMALDEGTRVDAVVDPAWRVPGYRKPEGRPLILRHPAFGWLGFVFPEGETAHIASWLTRPLPEEEGGAPLPSLN